MKFCQRLRAQREDIFGGSDAEAQTLDYKRLKKAISALRTRIDAGRVSRLDLDDAVQLWLEDFEREVLKFDTYYTAMAGECRRELMEYEESLGGCHCAGKDAIKESYLKLQELKFFVELNKEAARKILKKMDKNVPGYDTMRWREVEGARLESFREDPLQEAIARVTAVYAAFYHNNNAKLAEMQLDYYVNCNSEVFSYMIENGTGRQEPDVADLESLM